MPLTIDVYSDVICPWCYVGKKNLEKALTALPRPIEVQVKYHPFELNPHTPEAGFDRKQYLGEKYGARIEQAHQYLSQLGSEAGIDFQFDRAQKIPNTLKAHRLLLLAEKEGLQEKLAERFFRAYFSEGLDLGDSKILKALAVECGLDAKQAEKWLEGREGEKEVRSAETKAHEEGIYAVPHFIIGEARLSGAQSPETLARVILEETSE
jgi:predicted DsbA family dithiol-disulfide isomerase